MRRRRQKGQAMLEYALIAATVTVGFAAASQLGVSDAFLQRLQEAQKAWNILIPNDLNSLVNAPGDFNNQIVLR